MGAAFFQLRNRPRGRQDVKLGSRKNVFSSRKSVFFSAEEPVLQPPSDHGKLNWEASMFCLGVAFLPSCWVAFRSICWLAGSEAGSEA